MKKIFLRLLLGTCAILICGAGFLFSQSYSVVLDEPENGTFKVDPPLQADCKYPAGTAVTVTATPDKGYVLDAGYYSIPGMWGSMYHESPASPFKVTVDQDKHVGVSFIDKSEVDHINVFNIVFYAKPGREFSTYR